MIIMKRPILLLVLPALFTLTTLRSHAQGLSFFLMGGYGIGADKSQYYSWAFSDLDQGPVSYNQFPMTNIREINGLEYSEQVQSLSYASGGRVALGMDYMMTPYVGFGVTGEYLLGRTISSEKNTANDFIRVESFARAFAIRPSVVLTAGSEKINPFIRLGAAFAFPRIKSTAERGQPTALVLKDEVYGGTAFGFSGSLGAKYTLSDRVDLFAEAEYSLMRYTPKTRQINLFTLNGVDIIDKNYENRTIELSDNATFNEIKIEEKKQKSRIQPFSSLSFNLGLAFNIGK